MKCYFPDNVAYFYDDPDFDQYGESDNSKLLKDGAYILDTNPKISKERFYKAYERVFKDVSNREKLHQARQIFANYLDTE